MAYKPISGSLPQFARNASGAAANGYYLKGYASGTSTPLSMGIDATPSSTLAKCALNSRGEPISNDADENSWFIPHFDESYRLVLYASSTDADNDTLANAVWDIDGLNLDFDASSLSITINGLQRTSVQSYLENKEVADYAALRAVTGIANNDKISVRYRSFEGDGGGGTFYFDSSDLSSEVAADTRSGFYVAPTADLTGSAGAWVRSANNILFEYFGIDGTRANDSIAIRAAINYSQGSPVTLLNKRYFYDGTTIAPSFDTVRIYGTSMPQVNSGRTALENGSIIDGSFTFTVQNADLRNFGADVGSASAAAAGDAIRCSAPTLNAGGWLHTENLVGLGKSPSASNHAHLYQSYLRHTGSNLVGVYTLFGFVSKCQNVDLGTIYTDQNDESGVLLKSDTGFGRLRDVSIQTVTCDCSPSQKRGFHVQSSDDGVRDVQVDLIQSDGALENVLIQTGASGIEVRNVSIGQILSKNAQTRDFSIDAVNGTSSIFNVSVGKLITEGTQTYGIRVTGNGDTDDLYIGSAYINYEASASQATMDGSCFIGTNTTRSRIDDLTIVRNFSSVQIGGITYSSNLTEHVLGSRIANVFTLLENGVSEPSLTGTGNSLTIPVNASGQAFSHIRAAPTASGVEVNVFTAPVASAENFQRGYTLTIFNNSLFSMDILHNPSSGIYNTGGLTKTIAQNEAATWVYGGSGTWHGVS